MFGDETEIVVYNTLSVYLLLKKLEDMTSFPPETMKVKAVCDERETRIDNKAKTPELQMTISLLELDIFDGTPIEVDLKDEDEMNQEEE